MSDRLKEIREAVARDVANLEDAYADRAWLLVELDKANAKFSNFSGNPHLNGQAAEQLPQKYRYMFGGR